MVKPVTRSDVSKLQQEEVAASQPQSPKETKTDAAAQTALIKGIDIDTTKKNRLPTVGEFVQNHKVAVAGSVAVVSYIAYKILNRAENADEDDQSLFSDVNALVEQGKSALGSITGSMADYYNYWAASLAGSDSNQNNV